MGNEADATTQRKHEMNTKYQQMVEAGYLQVSIGLSFSAAL